MKLNDNFHPIYRTFIQTNENWWFFLSFFINCLNNYILHITYIADDNQVINLLQHYLNKTNNINSNFRPSIRSKAWKITTSSVQNRTDFRFLRLSSSSFLSTTSSSSSTPPSTSSSTARSGSLSGFASSDSSDRSFVSLVLKRTAMRANIMFNNNKWQMPIKNDRLKYLGWSTKIKNMFVNRRRTTTK